ncbi:MAG TPA: DUF2336 domain-containing protein [Xanthobacteraceae bacterium]|nr:DUF2336 domain-containing protein [Xanthobacteraceae bacterium]
MNQQQSLLEQLEEAVAQKDIHYRAETLRRVTDLFIAGAGTFSPEQLSLFDDVLGRLVEEIDVAARATFGARLAVSTAPPPRVMRDLALDDAIEVAGPVLAQSTALDEATLVESASSKSQQHLLAISRRATLPEAVTDVLVVRGDREVAVSTAANEGAKFSQFGYAKLVQRAERDGELALVVWVRPEIPREHLLAMFTQASEAVRLKLEAAGGGKGGALHDVVAQASRRLQTGMREGSAAYASARTRVLALRQAGRLDEAALMTFAGEARFDETTIALSFMADLPIGMVERAITNRKTEQILVLAKAIGLGWDCARALLLLQAGVNGSSTPQLDQCCATFARLQQDTARKAMQFYRLRERAAAAEH